MGGAAGEGRFKGLVNRLGGRTAGTTKGVTTTGTRTFRPGSEGGFSVSMPELPCGPDPPAAVFVRVELNPGIGLIEPILHEALYFFGDQ